MEVLPGFDAADGAVIEVMGCWHRGGVRTDTAASTLTGERPRVEARLADRGEPQVTKDIAALAMTSGDDRPRVGDS
jgi:hypothetical protein